MRANQHRLNCIRENILMYLSQADEVLCTIVPPAVGVPGVRGDEPWIERLFERRRGLQSTLAEIDEQLSRRSA